MIVPVVALHAIRSLQGGSIVYEQIFRLDGKVAVLPGGAGGIGAALARGLAEYGADVVIAGRSVERARAVANDLAATGRRTMALSVEVTDPESVRRLVEEVVGQFGRLDILVNCVGTQYEAPAEEFPFDQWKRVMEVNVAGTFLTCQAAGRVMIAQRSGSIINLSSVRGQLAIRRGYAAYTPSKAAVNNLTRQLATEWAPYNVRVNAIAPTFIETPLVANMLADPEFRRSLTERIPLGRVGVPADIVGATIFLASPASSFITGHILLVDGGVTATQ
ncbi:MAG: glucose 1-dehydrogenase [Chloroflexi bacterium]|nr:glucose 1-dehydrogenase [Chloroflexota bacterium]